jgi:hypothetical protein
MNNEKEEAIKIASGNLAVFPSEGRLTRVGSNVGSPLRFELTPSVLSKTTELALTLTAIPIDFVRANGTQTGYSVGCFEANFRLNVAPGRLKFDPIDQAEIEFTGTVEKEHEKGFDLGPKVEVKAGTEGAGFGGELGGYTRKKKDRKSSSAKGSSDDPRTKCFILQGGSHVHWIITPSPVLSNPPALQHSVAVSGEGHWPDERKGQIQIWGRRYVFGDGTVKLSGPGQLKAKFVHWFKTLKIYDDRRPELFVVVKTL